MIELIKYKLDGTIVDEYEVKLNDLNNILGTKVRCTYNNKKQVIGYLSVNKEFYQTNRRDLSKYLELWTLKDFDKNKPYDIYEQEFRKLDISNLDRIEAILHSNPRWGTPPSNDFEFNKRKIDIYDKPLNETKEYIDKYFGKKVIVFCKESIKPIKGTFISYQRPYDNEEECWTIDIEQDGTIYSLLETEIDAMFIDN